jgi:hypothetical protein
MVGIKVEISKFVDNSQPGWVECHFTDVVGEEHIFVEKVPGVTADYLDENSSYPQIGFIDCNIIKETNINGQRVIEVDTVKPWGIESIKGKCRFTVFPEQLIEQ